MSLIKRIRVQNAPTLVLLCLLGLFPLACDRSNSSSSNDPVETNFGLNLKAVIDSEGVPDSVVAIVSKDGSVTDTIHLSASARDEANQLWFPLNAPEGVNISVTYRVYKDDGVVAVGQASWSSGGTPYSPRPNLAPRVWLNDPVDVIVRRGEPFRLRVQSKDPEDNLRALLVDWTGDGVMDDSIVPPTGRDSLLFTWNDPGRYLLSAWVRDEKGLLRRDTLSVLVVPMARIALSENTTASIGDTFAVQVSMTYDNDSAQATSTRLFWDVAGDTSTTPMHGSRNLVWSDTGTYSVVVSAIDTAGEASRDTMTIRVVSDVPTLDLENFPKLVNLGAIASLYIGVNQSYGTIVSWGIDFDGNTSEGWDLEGTGPLSSVQHLFSRSGEQTIRVFVVDDDGNRVEASKVVPVGTDNLNAVLRRISTTDTTVSLGDTVRLRFARSFPEGVEALSSMEWLVEGGELETTSVVLSRSFTSDQPGTRWICWRIVTPFGSSVWDTVHTTIESDAPTVVEESFPSILDVAQNVFVTFSPTVTQSYGTIVSWGMDFDGDTTSGWDTTLTGKPGNMQHMFPKAGETQVLLFVVDDDGNRVVVSATVTVASNGADVLLRQTADTLRASINDTVVIRFRSNFPLGTIATSRLERIIDAASPETLAVDTAMRFRWDEAGTHVVRTRVLTAAGASSPDSTVIEVLQDVPTIDFSLLPDSASMDEQTSLVIVAHQDFGRIVHWSVDFDGDTTSHWDRSGTGPIPAELLRSFPSVGDANLLVKVLDDDGNEAIASHVLPVVKGINGMVQRAMSADTTVSIRDSAWVRLRYSGLNNSSRLEWHVDDATPETLLVADARAFRWDDVGDHVVRFRALGSFGTTGWDSLSVHVVQDVPAIDRSMIPAKVAVNDLVSLKAIANQAFGRIVSWAMDFDGDTSVAWDTIASGSLPTTVIRTFPAVGDVVLRVKVLDDDGNWASDSVAIQVEASGLGILQRAVSRDTTVSIRDTAWVRLRASSALATSMLLEWRIDDTPAETLTVAESRAFRWDAVGDHVVRFRALGAFGSTGWDSVSIHVVQGTPRIVAIFRSGSGVGQTITFADSTDPVFGSIMKERWDFGNDGVWDDSSEVVTQAVGHVFASSTPTSIRVEVTDDDGNVDDTVFVFSARNSKPQFGPVSFSDDTVGVTLSATLSASLSDSDGANDLSQVKVDWDNNGTWDSTRSVSGLSSVAFKQSWSLPGTKLVRLLLLDRSGDSAVTTASIRVESNPPKIVSLLPPLTGTTSRIGDTVRFTASIVDKSLPADLESATLIRYGMKDTVISLNGRSSIDLSVPVTSRVVGTHSFKVIVKDLVGNVDSASSTWKVVAAAPFAKVRLSDTILVAGDTAHLILDSLRAGNLGGTIASVSWSYKGTGAWTNISSPLEGGRAALRLPNPGARDASWYLAVRTTQDNGEVWYDTARSDLLESIVDNRNGVRYPVVTIGGTQWMGRNLRYMPPNGATVVGTCPTGADCTNNGYSYSKPVALANQASGKGAIQSVCPEGWRLPSRADWDNLDATAHAAYPSEPNSEVLLRSRNGWDFPLASQQDPLRFAATRSVVSGLAGTTESSFWWFYDSLGFGVTSLSLGNMIPNGGEDLTKSRDVRCVRNTKVAIDSSWKPSNRRVRMQDGRDLVVRALLPDSVASVRITVTGGGQSNSIVATPLQLTKGFETHIALPMVQGRINYTITLNQLGKTVSDTMNMLIMGNTADNKYPTTRIGNQVWMAEDVKTDTVAVNFGADSLYGYHYTLNAIFGGTAPERPTAGQHQVICPNGMHIPSVVEWMELFDTLRNQGLDPQTALRGASPFWTAGLPAPSDDYGFNALPIGRYMLGWKEGSYFWGADEQGYSMMAIVSASGRFLPGGQAGWSSLQSTALPLRCVGD